MHGQSPSTRVRAVSYTHLRAKTYIRALSGCVPYWIQWICLACGKYAVARKHRHLGFNEVNDVVRVLTGEVQPGKGDTWESLDETNFHNNQVDPENIAEDVYKRQHG